MGEILCFEVQNYPDNPNKHSLYMNARPITVQPHAVIRTQSPFCRSANAARFYPRIFLCFEGLKGLGRSAPRRRRLSLSKKVNPFVRPDS